jgi:hypothetical protein
MRMSQQLSSGVLCTPESGYLNECIPLTPDGAISEETLDLFTLVCGGLVSGFSLSLLVS